MLLRIESVDGCVAGCTCTVVKEKEGSETGKNVVCKGNTNTQTYTTIEQLQPDAWPEDTLYL